MVWEGLGKNGFGLDYRVYIIEYNKHIKLIIINTIQLLLVTIDGHNSLISSLLLFSFNLLNWLTRIFDSRWLFIQCHNMLNTAKCPFLCHVYGCNFGLNFLRYKNYFSPNE
jgi:hypothetical protein